MKMFKRLICLALVAILCVGLVACGGSGETSVPEPSSEDTGSHREPYKEEAPKTGDFPAARTALLFAAGAAGLTGLLAAMLLRRKEQE